MTLDSRGYQSERREEGRRRNLLQSISPKITHCCFDGAHALLTSLSVGLVTTGLALATCTGTVLHLAETHEERERIN